MKKILVKLSSDLKNMNYNEISDDINDIQSKADNLDKWIKLLDECNKPIPKQAIGKAIDLIKESIKAAREIAPKLKQFSEDDVLEAVSLSKKISQKHDFNSLNKQAQLKALKQFGKSSLRLMPLVGFIFSGGLAIKNLVYAFAEYKNLVGHGSNVGLQWYETLSSNKINNKISLYDDNPEKLMVVLDVCKSAKVFVDEGISLIANSIDYVKDLMFFIIEIVSAAGSTIIPTGWFATLGITSLDVGLSLIIGIIENNAEASAKEGYNAAISKIKDIAAKKISSFEDAKYKELDLDSLFDIILNYNS